MAIPEHYEQNQLKLSSLNISRIGEPSHVTSMAIIIKQSCKNIHNCPHQIKNRRAIKYLNVSDRYCILFLGRLLHRSPLIFILLCSFVLMHYEMFHFVRFSLGISNPIQLGWALIPMHHFSDWAKSWEIQYLAYYQRLRSQSLNLLPAPVDRINVIPEWESQLLLRKN